MKIRFQVVEVVERKEPVDLGGAEPVLVRRTTLRPVSVQGKRTVAGDVVIVEKVPTTKRLEIDAETEVDVSPSVPKNDKDDDDEKESKR